MRGRWHLISHDQYVYETVRLHGRMLAQLGFHVYCDVMPEFYPLTLSANSVAPLRTSQGKKERASRIWSTPAIAAHYPWSIAGHLQFEPDGLTVTGHPCWLAVSLKVRWLVR